MIEPLFGSASPAWPAIPAPALGWPQLTSPLSHSMSGTTGFSTPTTNALPTNQQQSLAPMAFAQPMFFANPNVGVSLVPSPYGVSAFPALVSPEVATSSAIRALLEAVAVRRGQPLGPTNDQECEDFIFDAFELIPSASEVDVRCEAGRITLTGSVQQKRLKHDVGEIAWSIPGVNDVQNNITIVNRRRARSTGREVETPAASPGRKTA